MPSGAFDWQPYGPYLAESRVARFMAAHNIATWRELIDRSTQDIDWFWPAALDFLGVEWVQPYHRLYDDSLGLPWTKWFIGGRLNIVHNCLDRHVANGLGDQTALTFEADNGDSRSVTYRELQALVNRAAAGLLARGIQPGDVVAMCLPISIEAVAIMLATLKIGAVSMQISSRVGVAEAVDCLNRGQARLLFLNDSYPRGGKWTDCAPLREAALRVPSIEAVISVRRGAPAPTGDPRSLLWDDFLASLSEPPQTAHLDAEHPALILFSSGTTGRSKAVVHTHGGTLAQVAKEVGFAFDCRQDDVFYWFTNIGWMMAPWEIIGGLFFGATVVLYEGTHLYPTPYRLFELVQKHRISIFGSTPTAMRMLAKAGLDVRGYDPSSLRILGSTGEVLDAETWRWYFDTFGDGRCPIINISGGTEIIGCFLSPLPVMPLKASTLGAPGLGMAVDIVDDEGRSVRGGGGRLVCHKPFPSMTRGFLGDPEGYLREYFSQWPGIWTHPDRAEVDADGLWYILGRADDVIVSGGTKYDPGKIEAAAIGFPGEPAIREAVAIGVRDEVRGERIVCFVVPAGAGGAVAALDGIRQHVRESYDRTCILDEVHVVSGLPKNVAGKIPRGLIRRAYEGEEIGDLSRVDGAESLEEIARLGQASR